MPFLYSSLMAAMVALMPALALPTRSGTSIVFYLLLIASLAGLASRRHGLAAWRSGLRDHVALAVALALPTASLALTAMAQGGDYSSTLEKCLRFTLTLPIFWTLLQLRPAHLRQVQWGILAAAIGGAGMLVFVIALMDGIREDMIDIGSGYNAVSFANIVMLAGLSAFLSLGWRLTRWRRLEAGLKIAAGVLCLFAVVISETRGSWLVVPIFMPIALRAYTSFRLRWLALALLAGTVLLGLLAAFEPGLNARVMEGVSDVRQFFDGTARDTSLGVRLQLWYAALYTFAQHPWFGIGGMEAFSHMLHTMAGQGLVSEFVARDFGEPHNDYLAALAGFGIFGFIAMVAVYAVPAWYFCRRLQGSDLDARVAAALGLLLCLGFAVFSLSEYMFRGMRMVPFYTVLMATFLALSRPEGAPAGRAAA